MRMKNWRFGWVFLVLGVLCGGTVSNLYAAEGRYLLYEPEITRYMVYEGQDQPGHFPYNHCCSIAWFDGRYYVVWNANFVNAEGADGQKIYLSTSTDLKHWSEPVNFVDVQADNPITNEHGRQWQPNLINYQDRELWCSWFLDGSSSEEWDGTYVSKLTRGADAKWHNQKIVGYRTIDGHKTEAIASQNPVVLRSGRVLVPLTFIGFGEGLVQRHRYNAYMFTDDGGQTWDCSNMVTDIQSHYAQWEPCIHEQADGTLRAFMRNFTKGPVPPLQRILTCTGTGNTKGTPVVLDQDPVYSRIETQDTRMQVTRLATHRYVMFYHDIYTPDSWNYNARYNGALFFSRLGADDFVAGPGFSRPQDVIAYPQGIGHDGKIIVAYTLGDVHSERSIEIAVCDPAPKDEAYYLWPRDKQVVHMKGLKRANPDYQVTAPYIKDVDDRKVVVFEQRGSAGVDIDPVETGNGQELELSFEFKIEQLQSAGNLILCSYGDAIPIRIGMPGNRPGKLYVYGGQQWQFASECAMREWHRLQVRFSSKQVTLRLDDGSEIIQPNPVLNPNRRLYLGDGYEVDAYESNRGSVFYIDLASLGTRIVN